MNDCFILTLVNLLDCISSQEKQQAEGFEICALSRNTDQEKIFILLSKPTSSSLTFDPKSSSRHMVHFSLLSLFYFFPFDLINVYTRGSLIPCCTIEKHCRKDMIIQMLHIFFAGLCTLWNVHNKYFFINKIFNLI